MNLFKANETQQSRQNKFSQLCNQMHALNHCVSSTDIFKDMVNSDLNIVLSSAQSQSQNNHMRIQKSQTTNQKQTDFQNVEIQSDQGSPTRVKNPMHIKIQYPATLESLESDFQNSKVSSKTFYNVKKDMLTNLITDQNNQKIPGQKKEIILISEQNQSRSPTTDQDYQNRVNGVQNELNSDDLRVSNINTAFPMSRRARVGQKNQQRLAQMIVQSQNQLQNLPKINHQPNASSTQNEQMTLVGGSTRNLSNLKSKQNSDRNPIKIDVSKISSSLNNNNNKMTLQNSQPQIGLSKSGLLGQVRESAQCESHAGNIKNFKKLTMDSSIEAADSNERTIVLSKDHSKLLTVNQICTELDNNQEHVDKQQQQEQRFETSFIQGKQIAQTKQNQFDANKTGEFSRTVKSLKNKTEINIHRKPKQRYESETQFKQLPYMVPANQTNGKLLDEKIMYTDPQ